MANLKQALDKQVTRGESLGQIIIALIVILGVTQFTSILASQRPASPTNETTSVGATGAPGAAGADGVAGKDGEPGANGINGSTGAKGLMGPIGLTGGQGATGPQGIPGSFSTSYGQLTASSQGISIQSPAEWVPIPFNVTGPSSNMTVSTTSPATITVNEDGVCQINISVYFSSEDSDEGSFTPATYTLGIKVGSGSVAPVAAIHASNAGYYLLNYSDIMDLSANDSVQFYIAASDAEPDIFSNIVTIENSNAYIMQISN